MPVFDATEPLRRIIRTEPVQQRSEQRITQLLDAAAAIISETGVRALTTTAVARRSNSSVGVLYRYFPNVHSLLRGLAGRNFERYVARLVAVMPEDPARWRDSATLALETFVDMMREEPGYRALGLGHGIDGPAFDVEDTSVGMLTQVFAAILGDRYGIPVDDELLFRLEVCVEISDGLVRRAFLHDPRGEVRFIEVARELVAAEIGKVGTVSAAA